MAIDSKYGRVTLEHGTIGEDEPVFVMRAQDSLVASVLKLYLQLCEDAGSPESHLEGIRSEIERIRSWQAEADNFTQVPRSEIQVTE